MRENDFLDKMELIDPAYVEAADAKPEKEKSVWIQWDAMAACLCLVVASALMISGRWNMPVFSVSDPSISDVPVPDLNGTIQLEKEPVESPPTTIIPGVVLDEPLNPSTLFYNNATSLEIVMLLSKIKIFIRYIL